MWENTTPSAELPRYFCAGIDSLQLGVMLVSNLNHCISLSFYSQMGLMTNVLIIHSVIIPRTHRSGCKDVVPPLSVRIPPSVYPKYPWIAWSCSRGDDAAVVSGYDVIKHSLSRSLSVRRCLALLSVLVHCVKVVFSSSCVWYMTSLIDVFVDNDNCFPTCL